MKLLLFVGLTLLQLHRLMAAAPPAAPAGELERAAQDLARYKTDDASRTAVRPTLVGAILKTPALLSGLFPDEGGKPPYSLLSEVLNTAIRSAPPPVCSSMASWICAHSQSISIDVEGDIYVDELIEEAVAARWIATTYPGELRAAQAHHAAQQPPESGRAREELIWHALNAFARSNAEGEPLLASLRLLHRQRDDKILASFGGEKLATVLISLLHNPADRPAGATRELYREALRACASTKLYRQGNFLMDAVRYFQEQHDAEEKRAALTFFFETVDAADEDAIRASLKAGGEEAVPMLYLEALRRGSPAMLSALDNP